MEIDALVEMGASMVAVDDVIFLRDELKLLRQNISMVTSGEQHICDENLKCVPYCAVCNEELKEDLQKVLSTLEAMYSRTLSGTQLTDVSTLIKNTRDKIEKRDKGHEQG